MYIVNMYFDTFAHNVRLVQIQERKVLEVSESFTDIAIDKVDELVSNWESDPLQNIAFVEYSIKNKNWLLLDTVYESE